MRVERDGEALFAMFVLLALTVTDYTKVPGILLNGLCAESPQVLTFRFMTNCPIS